MLFLIVNLKLSAQIKTVDGSEPQTACRVPVFHDMSVILLTSATKHFTLLANCSCAEEAFLFKLLHFSHTFVDSVAIVIFDTRLVDLVSSSLATIP